jgi:hypothetical protein
VPSSLSTVSSVWCMRVLVSAINCLIGLATP